MSSASAQMDGLGVRVIEPKLMPPRVHPGMLRRARLLEMLDDDVGVGARSAERDGGVRQDDAWCGRGVLSVRRR